jgi:acetate kinase
MAPVILVLNSGSSSIKFSLYDGPTEQVTGQISGLGAKPHLNLEALLSGRKIDRALDSTDGSSHGAALGALLPILNEELGGRPVAAVGHRVVHGGTKHDLPVRITGCCHARVEGVGTSRASSPTAQSCWHRSSPGSFSRG